MSYNGDSMERSIRNNIIKLKLKPIFTNQTCLQETMMYMSDWVIEALPIICIFGVITNLINVGIFLNPRLNDQSFKYMLANSVSDLIYVTLFLIDYYVFKESTTYTAQMFFLLVDDYFSSSCAFFAILTDLILSLERLMIVTNKRYWTRISFKVAIPICSAISLVFYFPVLFLKNIQAIDIKNNNNTDMKFLMYPTDFGESGIGRATPIFLSSVKIFLAIVLLSLVNIITTSKLKTHLKKKIIARKKTVIVKTPNRDHSNVQTQNSETQTSPIKSISRRSVKIRIDGIKKVSRRFAAAKASRNITLMVVWTCFLYIFGTTPYALCYIGSFILPNSYELKMLTNFSLGMLFLSHGVNIFVYFSYNNLFRDVFFSCFRSVITREKPVDL